MKRKITVTLLAAFLLFAVSAFASEYTDKETVQKVQQILNNDGYNCGTPDGVAGKNTKAAISEYQKTEGLTVTGVIDDELLSAMGLIADETSNETVSEKDEGQLPVIPDGVEIWIKDEQNYALFDDNTGTLTAYIDWLEEPVVFSYTIEDDQYIIDDNKAEIKKADDEMEVTYFEQGTITKYHRGNEEEYAKIVATFAENSDTQWLIGEWKLQKFSGEPAGKIIINSDGTCLLNDEEYTWKEGVEERKEEYGISLYSNGIVKYSVVGTSTSEEVKLMQNSHGTLIGDTKLVK